MDIKKFAKSISEKEYGYPQFTKEEIQTAKDNGFVIVYGASDDLIEFEGAMRDEGDVWDGGTVYLTENGICKGDELSSPNFINAIWGKDDISWQYETDIPHETFNIMEDGEVYCIGIVFHIEGLNSWNRTTKKCRTSEDDNTDELSKEMVAKALEKQMPKMPDYEGDGYADGELVYDTWICPNCETHYEVGYDDYKYCPNCGQAIDWNDGGGN